MLRDLLWLRLREGGGSLHGEPRARLSLPRGLQGGAQNYVGLFEGTQEDRSDLIDTFAMNICDEGVVIIPQEYKLCKYKCAKKNEGPICLL